MKKMDVEDIPEAIGSKESSIGCLQQTGGHQLITRKPFFTSDSKFLLICSGNQLRRYLVETGAFVTSHDFNLDYDLISAQLMPNNSDEVMVTSSNGWVIVWNLAEDIKVDEYSLKVSRSFDTLIWSQLVSDCLYYIIESREQKGHQKSNQEIKKCQLYYSHLNVKKRSKDLAKQLVHFSEVNPNTNSVAFCPTTDPRFCVFVEKSYFNFSEIPVKISSIKRRHTIKDDLYFTCIVSHPSDEVVATADSLGRIIIWNNFVKSNSPSRSVLHWHQWPIQDLCFSPEGSSLYSVGSEMTLVGWDLTPNHFAEQSYLPRLGAPLKFVNIDSNQNIIVTSHEDNTIKILEPNMKGIKCVIEGMISANELSTGLLWNSKLEAIVSNGRIGCIQFYSPILNKQLFELDVVQQNLISSSNHFKVYPTEVTKAAVSGDGIWISTLEMRDDFETLPEIRLKFWEFNQKEENYNLNSTIHLPHNSEVNCLEFSPTSESMVSTSTDREFKIWYLVEDDDKKWWKCFKVGNLNNVSIPTIAKWSSDSSLLSIAFDNFITLWDVFDKSVLKFMTKLSVEEKSDSKLIFIDFGTENYSHYLIEGRHYSVKVWNLLDLTVVWTHITNEMICCISFNKWENKLAVVSDQIISFFKINSKETIGSVSIGTNQRMIFALFTDETPDTNNSETEPLFEESKFYCINERQEIFVFSPNKNKIKEIQMDWNTEEILSPIARLLIDKKERKETLNNDDLQPYFKTNKSVRKLVEDMFFTVPSHVLPPIDILSKTFLQSLNNCREKEDIKKEKGFKSPKDFDIKPLVNAFESQSDLHSNSTNLDTNERESETNEMTVENDSVDNQNDFIEEDYSWLKTALNNN